MRIATVLLVLGGLLLLPACGDEESSGGSGASAANTAPDPRRRPQPLVYGVVPSFELTTQDEETLSDRDLLGRVWVCSFFFTRCRGTCPAQMQRLQEAQAALVDHPRRADIHFVNISVDADHDRPAIMREYSQAYDADLEHWTFLTGDRRAIWELATEGFRMPAGPDPTNEAMPIGHTAMFLVVDRRGRIRDLVDSQQRGSTEKLLTALEPLVAEPAPTNVLVPAAGIEEAALEERARAQQEAAASWTVRHDFRFRNGRFASGIRFENRCTDDSGKDYKVVHYDHGNGVSAADVDGDGLLDLYFCNQVGGNQLWRNLGEGRFEDITEEAGVALADAVGVTGSFADTDNDGDPDLYVTTVYGGNHLLRNDGTGRFEDITAAAGLTHRAHSSSGVFFDYDRDGLLDLLLCNVGVYTQEAEQQVGNDSTTAALERGTFRYRLGLLDGFSGHLKSRRTEPCVLYRNLGGNRFADVGKELGFEDGSWSGAATPIDANGDGWLDLYVLNMQGHDEYYENVEGRAFKRRSRELFPRTPWGSMGVKVFDFDADGDFDLYLTDMHSDMSKVIGPAQEKLKSTMLWPESITRSEGKSIWGNALFRCDGADRYAEVSDAVGAENFWPWGLSVGDLNADGYDDVFITSGMSYPFRYGINSVLLNDGGRAFLDSEFVLGVEPRSEPLTKAWFDLDCGADGLDGYHEQCGERQGPVVVWGTRSSRSSVLFDLDGDGDLDIVTNEFNSAPQVLVSDLAQRGACNRLSIRLQGTRANRSGLGAIVRVHVGGKVFSQVHDGQSGYLAQSDMPLYFGLGAHESADKVEVTWLGGATQVIEKPRMKDGVLRIVQP